MYDWLQRVWYRDDPSGIVLRPLSWLFALLSGARRWAYRAGLKRTVDVGRPVIVVGNITVGGTGKTPLTLWLAEQLRARGLRVGIAMRGHGGSSSAPRLVAPASSAAEVGDEPALVARRDVAAVAVGHDRVAVAQLLVDNGCNLIIADDGLQHLRLARQFEIVVIDGARGFGNGRLLPAGPLREPAARLRSASAVVINGSGQPAAGIRMSLRARAAVSVADGARQEPLQSFAGQGVHALAGIGNPGRFFATLRAHGIEPIEHPLPDHAALAREDIVFDDALPVLMTEKDAVKCASFADARHWFVPVEASFGAADAQRLLNAVAPGAAASAGRVQAPSAAFLLSA